MEDGRRFRQNGHVAKTLGLPIALILLGISCGPSEGPGPVRALSNFRVEQLPLELPDLWKKSLEMSLANAPSAPLLGPGSKDIVRRALVDVGWIDPASVTVEDSLPEGLRVTFKSRRPLYRVFKQGIAVGVVSHEGVLLPPGLGKGGSESSQMEFLRNPKVPLDADTLIPMPGRKPADPVLSEALRAWPEIQSIEGVSGLDIVRVERQAELWNSETGFWEAAPRDETGIPPPLCFVLGDGREIYWGRSERANDPFGVPLGLKAARLGAVMKKYPDFGPIYRLVLDFPKMRAFDHEGRDLAQIAALEEGNSPGD